MIISTRSYVISQEEQEISPIISDLLSWIAFFGHPRGRNIDWSPSCLAVDSCHDSEPKGRHRRTEAFTASRSFFQGLVHTRDPVVRAWNWPWTSNRFLLVFCGMQPTPKAIPSPILDPFDHCRSYGVPFHIMQNRIQMMIFLDGK